MLLYVPCTLAFASSVQSLVRFLEVTLPGGGKPKDAAAAVESGKLAPLKPASNDGNIWR